MLYTNYLQIALGHTLHCAFLALPRFCKPLALQREYRISQMNISLVSICFLQAYWFPALVLTTLSVGQSSSPIWLSMGTPIHGQSVLSHPHSQLISRTSHKTAFSPSFSPSFNLLPSFVVLASFWASFWSAFPGCHFDSHFRVVLALFSSSFPGRSSLIFILISRLF